MSHRAAILRRENAGYDLYESRNAGFVIDGSIARRELIAGNPDLLLEDVTPTEALRRVDPTVHEALYLWDERPRAYRVLCFRVPTANGIVEGDIALWTGALVAVEGVHDPEPDGLLRGWFEAARACVGESVDRGHLSEREAIPELRDRLARFAAGAEVIYLPPGDDLSLG